MGIGGLFEKDDKEFITFRCPKGLSLAIDQIMMNKQINRTTLLIAMISDSIINYDNDLLFEGIDLKEHAKLTKLELLRNLTKKERNEFMSSNLFMIRVKADIYKLMMLSSKRVKTNPKAVLKRVLDYLKIREKEAKHYKNAKEILEELDLFKEEAKKNLENIKSIIDQSLQIEGIKI